MTCTDCGTSTVVEPSTLPLLSMCLLQSFDLSASPKGVSLIKQGDATSTSPLVIECTSLIDLPIAALCQWSIKRELFLHCCQVSYIPRIPAHLPTLVVFFLLLLWYLCVACIGDRWSFHCTCDEALGIQEAEHGTWKVHTCVSSKGGHYLRCPTWEG